MRKVFLLAGAVWLLLNLLTLTMYPSVWVDEILLSDAGMHLESGKGFVSSAWFNQPSWEFWAGYTPLYSFAIAGWLKLFGISALAVRSFGLALVAASLSMIWLFLKRMDDEPLRWTIVLALAVCEPLAFLERAGRPDSLSLLLLTATALVFRERTWRWRNAMLWILGALALPSALQYTAYMVVLIALLHLWFKPFARRDLVLWGTGVLSGAAALAVLYATHGVLKLFVEVTLVSKHSSAGRLLQNILLGHRESPFVLADIAMSWFRDYATPVLIAGGVGIWVLAKQQKLSFSCKLSLFGLASAVSIPLAIQILGKYPLYYTYMGTAPAAIAILMAGGQLRGKPRLVNATILLCLLAGGAGRLWWKGWNQGVQMPFDLDRYVSSKDVVIADYPAYYQLIGRSRELFAVDYGGGKLMPHLPPTQADQVSKLIVRDSRFAEIAGKVGGQWRRTGSLSFVRHGAVEVSAIIDDDTRNPKVEAIGIYERVASAASRRK